MIAESSGDGAASPRPYFDSELTYHGLNASWMLLMHFDFAPRSQKLPLGVLLHALLESFQSLAVPPRFSSTTKKDDDSKSHKGEGRRTICPKACLRLCMARVRLESPTSWHGSREPVYRTMYSCHDAPRRHLAPTNLITPPQAMCVSCVFSAAVCSHPKRRDTCIMSR